ncbi:hypothetical protein HPB52_011659 [Rhipicephalus sanguineus]|uniref:Uncharacterized protein n=1 Tax=Rhipicephalus sanguineus TaxID=34632 RepID=A0A9D4T9Q2_RHISA|nr:hypothetical protein HPB52_011659 [Rhipicephalus sanguineus]
MWFAIGSPDCLQEMLHRRHFLPGTKNLPPMLQPARRRGHRRCAHVLQHRLLRLPGELHGIGEYAASLDHYDRLWPLSYPGTDGFLMRFTIDSSDFLNKNRSWEAGGAPLLHKRIHHPCREESSQRPAHAAASGHDTAGTRCA